MPQSKQPPDQTKRDYSYPPSCRIKRRPEILELQQKGNKLFSRHFVILVSPSERFESRLAVTITKKVHKRAVMRNSIKRKVREVFRLYRSKLAGSFDILVIARKNAFEVDFFNVRRELLGALHHGGFLRS